jgi:thioredoxin-dependent peroxiredoxin
MPMSKLLLVAALCLAFTGAIAGQTAVELKVGDKAPDFSLPGTDGKAHKLSDYKGKAVVIAWYPAALTSGCTIECRSFRDSQNVIKSYDVAYFMASVDTPDKNLQFAKMEEANFPLLSDPEKKVAGAYGVLNARGTANRWTFYIGPDGTIQYIDKAVNQQIQELTNGTCTTGCGPGPKLAAKLAELNVKKVK